MKLTYSDNFSFCLSSKAGKFFINPTGVDTDGIFCIYTSSDRDMNQSGTSLTWPGEYEFQDMVIQTFSLPNNIMGAKVIAEGVRMVFLPSLETPLNEHEMEILGNVDMLILQIQTMSPAFKKMVEEIDAKAIIGVGAAQEKFYADMGATQAETTHQLTFSASSLPVDKTLFVKVSAAA